MYFILSSLCLGVKIFLRNSHFKSQNDRVVGNEIDGINNFVIAGIGKHDGFTDIGNIQKVIARFVSVPVVVIDRFLKAERRR